MKWGKYPLYETDEITDLRSMLDNCVKKFGDKDAFRERRSHDSYEGFSYNRLGSDVRALGTAICDRGLAGKTIAVIGESSYRWVVTYLAVVNVNSTVVPIDKEQPVGEIERLLKRTRATAFFYSDTYSDIIGELSGRLSQPLITVNLDGKTNDSLGNWLSHGEKLLAAGDKRYDRTLIDRERAAVILFTSGTTGRSKGVMLCHRNLAFDIMGACKMVGFTSDDVLFSVLPIHHTYECTCGIMCMLHYGTTVCFNDSFKNLLDNFKLFKPTSMFIVPLVAETLYNGIREKARKAGRLKKLDNGIRISNFLLSMGIDMRRRLFSEIHEALGGRLEKIISGGAYLNPQLPKKFRELGIHVFQGYGVTECSPLIAVNRNCHYKDAAVGMALPGLNIMIDADDQNGIGEILVKGENVMLGYFDDQEMSRASLRDGWYRTGDMGYMDGDGFLYITGRQKNMIVLKNGKNVYPEEIEALLLESPIVKEVVVCEGTSDSGGINTIIARIFPRHSELGGLSPEEVRAKIGEVFDEVNSRLPYYKQLAEFVLVDKEFPKNTSQKLIRY